MILTKSVQKLVEKYEVLETIVKGIDHSLDIHFEMIDLKNHANKIIHPFEKTKAFASISILPECNKYILVLEGNNTLYDLNYHYISKDLNSVYCKLTRLKNGDYNVLNEMTYESGLTYNN